MTDDMIALRELLEKGSDATLLREMIGFAAQRLMELETEALCGAGHGERSEGRTNLRNGYRDRDWHTRAGGRLRPGAAGTQGVEGTQSVATHRTSAPSVLRSSDLRQPPRRSRVARHLHHHPAGGRGGVVLGE
jgi:hypothetical protein